MDNECRPDNTGNTQGYHWKDDINYSVIIRVLLSFDNTMVTCETMMYCIVGVVCGNYFDRILFHPPSPSKKYPVTENFLALYICKKNGIAPQRASLEGLKIFIPLFLFLFFLHALFLNFYEIITTIMFNFSDNCIFDNKIGIFFEFFFKMNFTLGQVFKKTHLIMRNVIMIYCI